MKSNKISVPLGLVPWNQAKEEELWPCCACFLIMSWAQHQDEAHFPCCGSMSMHPASHFYPQRHSTLFSMISKFLVNCLCWGGHILPCEDRSSILRLTEVDTVLCSVFHLVLTFSKYILSPISETGNSQVGSGLEILWYLKDFSCSLCVFNEFLGAWNALYLVKLWAY